MLFNRPHTTVKNARNVKSVSLAKLLFSKRFSNFERASSKKYFSSNAHFAYQKLTFYAWNGRETDFVVSENFDVVWGLYLELRGLYRTHSIWSRLMALFCWFNRVLMQRFLLLCFQAGNSVLHERNGCFKSADEANQSVEMQMVVKCKSAAIFPRWQHNFSSPFL